MSEVTITVRGEHEVRVAPERATVRLSIGQEGPDRGPVVERTLALAAPLREGIEARAASGAVEEWTSRRLTVRSERPWNNEGRRLDPVFHADVEFTATFSDLSDLSLWITEISAAEGVTVLDTTWSLTSATRAAVEREVASEAVAVAVVRANAYAAALGLARVEPVEIADTGLISAGPAPAPAPYAKAMRAEAYAAADAGSGVELQGEDIAVSATVEARFRAS